MQDGTVAGIHKYFIANWCKMGQLQEYTNTSLLTGARWDSCRNTHILVVVVGVVAGDGGSSSRCCCWWWW